SAVASRGVFLVRNEKELRSLRNDAAAMIADHFQRRDRLNCHSRCPAHVLGEMVVRAEEYFSHPRHADERLFPARIAKRGSSLLSIFRASRDSPAIMSRQRRGR